MNIICVPKQAIINVVVSQENLKFINGNWALISIIESVERPFLNPQRESILSQLNCKAILKLIFSDIKPSYNHEDEILFNKDHARQIISFVNNLKEIDTLVIHCHAGVSRSGAVGVFLAKYLNVDFEKFKEENKNISPNEYILDLLMEESNSKFEIEPFWNKPLTDSIFTLWE
jgi:predicted protein tyrosine phosphatase